MTVFFWYRERKTKRAKVPTEVGQAKALPAHYSWKMEELLDPQHERRANNANKPERVKKLSVPDVLCPGIHRVSISRERSREENTGQRTLREMKSIQLIRAL